MAVRVRFTFSLLLLGIFFLPVVAVAQAPAAISYNAIGYGSIAAAEAPLRFSSVGNTFQPMLVAQNTAPANVTLPTGVPTGVPTGGLTPPALAPLDPYASSGTSSFAGSILNIGNPGRTTPVSNATTGGFSGNFDKFIPETTSAIRRFRDRTSAELTHIPGGNDPRDFGMDKIDLRMQLAIPSQFIPNNRADSPGKGVFYIAPGGSIVWWNGPVHSLGMAPSGFETYLDFGAEPKFNEVFGINAWGRFGIFSDFRKIHSESFRLLGRVEGIFRTQNQLQVHFGVLYLGRERVQWLPTGGVVWQPDENWVVKAIFPNPKVSRRLHRGQQTDWWGYVCADYAGGAWTIEPFGLTDYNDVRLGMGIEYSLQDRIGAYFELGGSFARELYSDGHRWASPPTALYLKMGVVF